MAMAVLAAATVGHCIKPMLCTGALGNWVVELLMCCPDASIEHVHVNPCACLVPMCAAERQQQKQRIGTDARDGTPPFQSCCSS